MADFDREDKRKPKWVVVCDYAPGLNAAAQNPLSQPMLMHWFQVLDLLETMLARGAVEVRIRPVKP